MTHAICAECIKDAHLKEIVRERDNELECSHCNELKRPAISVEDLASVLEPILREHFCLGEYHRHSGVQEGDPLDVVIYEVVGQDLVFMDALVAAIIDLDPADPRDGDDPLWSDTESYVATPVRVGHLYADWRHALNELKHSRRFFSPSAAALFGDLFSSLEGMRTWAEGAWKPVLFELPAGTRLYRARLCSSGAQRKAFYKDPLGELGPPPSAFARAGRMNADGVSVMYCALAVNTALAELRPAIGTEIACAAFETTATIRVLDFSRLEKAAVTELSYFQPDFTKQVERNRFLRKLHSLISHPIVPGREADYLVTQTMAEYLSHVHQPALGGIFFSSAQHETGTNVVLFVDPKVLAERLCESFPIAYVADSLRLHRVSGIQYTHEELGSFVTQDGDIVAWGDTEGIEDDY